MQIATNKDDMLVQVRDGWWRFQRALAQLEQNEMTDIPIEENWTVKDVVAHITFWESNLLTWMQETTEGRPISRPEEGLTDEKVDALNAENYRRNELRSIHDVLADAQETHQALMDVLLHLPEDPKDERYHAWRNGEPPWELIAGDTYEHYEEHIGPIEAYLLKSGKPGPKTPT